VKPGMNLKGETQRQHANLKIPLLVTSYYMYSTYLINISELYSTFRSPKTHWLKNVLNREFVVLSTCTVHDPWPLRVNPLHYENELYW